MKFIYNYLPILAVISLILFSCNEDKGNYDYHDINSVEIAEIAAHSSELGSTLNIVPELTFALGENEKSFSYTWYYISTEGAHSDRILSTERNMSVQVGGDNPLAESGAHSVVLKVKNLDTGIVYSSNYFTVTVRSRFAIGYLALCETNDGFELDMIAKVNSGADTLTVYNNLLKLSGSELPHTGGIKPLGITAYHDAYAPNPYYQGNRVRYSTWVYTDKGTDRLKAEDFSYSPDYNILSISSPSSPYLQGNVIAQKIKSAMPYIPSIASRYIHLKAYMYYNNSWFMNNGTGNFHFFSYPINRKDGKESGFFKTAPYIAPGILPGSEVSVGAMIYDTDNKRFMYQALPKGTSVDYYYTDKIMYSKMLDDTEFNNPDLSLIYMAEKPNTATGFAILQNNITSEYRYIEFVMNQSTAEKTVSRTIPSGQIKAAKFYARHPSAGVFYFATEDKIYSALIPDGGNIIVRDITSTVLKQGYKISLIKYTYPFSNRQLLLVASYAPGGTEGENGRLEFFQTNALTGDLTLAKNPEEKAEGSTYQIDMAWDKMGKIIDIAYKQQ